uniref:Tubulin tyrosine ligase n=1 Tax=Macrostomum lignano TaxID=282301 RepID=A0A1I8GU02_9PLAT
KTAHSSWIRHYCTAKRNNLGVMPLSRERLPQILSLPYGLAGRAASFRGIYGSQVGRAALPRQKILLLGSMSDSAIREPLNSLGYAQLSDETASNELATEADQNKLNIVITCAGQSHPLLYGPNYLILRPYTSHMYRMCSKWLLVRSLRQAEEKMLQRGLIYSTGSGDIFSHEEFTPFTVSMADDNLESVLRNHPGTYLAKTVSGSMGNKIQLVRIRRDHVREDLLSFLTSSEFQDMPSDQVIMQRYIERPLVADKRKFDLQLGYFVFMHPGFVRFSSLPYDAASPDLAVHLTNQSVQAKQTRTFSQLKEVTTWFPDELNDYFNKRHRLQDRDWAKRELYPKIGALPGYVSAVFRYFLDDRDCPSNAFRILGVDFLIDDELRLYLLEFNAYPAWGCQTSVLAKLKPSLWREAVCLSSEVTIRFRSRLPVAEQHLVTRQDFGLVFSSEEPELARRNVAKLYK